MVIEDTRKTLKSLDRRLCIAPMMEYTDRHDRYILRLLSRHTLLYTEMLTTGAILNGDHERFLAHHPCEHPLAVQLGGSDPTALAQCSRIAADAGYDEVNLNVGCPSKRVKSGRFGACLMTEPALVAECVGAMGEAAALPVTVKTRIGVDEHDSYEALAQLVETVSGAGCTTWIIHARKAWLNGLSPKENRSLPPLNYEIVHRLKRDFPDLEIILNGGIQTLEDVQFHLERTDGVMMGREAYRNPYLLSNADALIFGDEHPVPSRQEVVERVIPYVESQMLLGVPLTRITRHLLGLFQGRPGAKSWRRHISENAHKPGANAEVVAHALSLIPGS